MTKTLKLIGAALLALAILPAAVMLFHLVSHPSIASLVSLGLGIAGTVTFTYESFQFNGSFGGNFTGGSATPPTAAQAQQVMAMSALVGFTDTDTTFTFTHNWGLSAAAAAALCPQVLWQMVTPQTTGTTQVMPVISVNVTSSTNVVTFTKVQQTTSGCTISIWLRRPSSVSL